MRPLSSEQLLAIADEFCSRHRVRVRNFAGLAAAAAVPGARFEGIAVFDTLPRARAGLEEAVLRNEPLTARNGEFSRFCGQVYQRWAAETPL